MANNVLRPSRSHSQEVKRRRVLIQVCTHNKNENYLTIVMVLLVAELKSSTPLFDPVSEVL